MKSRSTAASVAASFLLAAVLPAQRDLANAFPADTWAVLTCAGLDAGAQTFTQAKAVGLVRETLGQEGLGTLEKMVRQQGGRDLNEALGFLQRIGLDANQVRQLLAGPFAFGVGRPTIAPVPQPSCALVAAIGENKAARDAIDALQALATQHAPQQLTRSSTTVAGASFTALQLPHGMGQLLHGVHDGCWFFSNSAGFVADCINALRGQVPSLASNATLTASRARLPGARMAELFLNTKQFGAALQPFVPYEAESFGRALGITGMPEVFVGCAHDGKAAHDVFELVVPGPTTGLLKAPFSKPLRNHAAQWLKPQTALFASFALDSAAAAQAAEHLMAALPPALTSELRRQFEREVGRELRRETGMTPADLAALFATLGPEVNVAFEIPMTVTVFVEVKDQARAEGMLGQLVQSGRFGQVQTEDVAGGKTWSVDLQTDGPRISPTVGLREGWLVASNFKSMVKRHMQAQGSNEKSLAADPRFQAAAKSATGSALFVTGRLQPVLDNFWGLAATAIKTGATQVGIEPEEMPDADDVAAAVDDVVVAGSVTESGFALKLQQPLGLGTLLPAAACALDWLLRMKPMPQGEDRARISARDVPASGKPNVQKIY